MFDWFISTIHHTLLNEVNSWFYLINADFKKLFHITKKSTSNKKEDFFALLLKSNLILEQKTLHLLSLRHWDFRWIENKLNYIPNSLRCLLSRLIEFDFYLERSLGTKMPTHFSEYICSILMIAFTSFEIDRVPSFFVHRLDSFENRFDGRFKAWVKQSNCTDQIHMPFTICVIIGCSIKRFDLDLVRSFTRLFVHCLLTWIIIIIII